MTNTTGLKSPPKSEGLMNRRAAAGSRATADRPGGGRVRHLRKFGLVTVACILILTGMQAWLSRNQALEQAAAENTRVARIAEDAVSRFFNVVDVALADLEETIRYLPDN
ncbi:MAG: hypothetical protein ACPGNT_11170, partial [Rhodospirillales bacterium]